MAQISVEENEVISRRMLLTVMGVATAGASMPDFTRAETAREPTMPPSTQPTPVPTDGSPAGVVQHTEELDKGVVWLARLGSGGQDHALLKQVMPAGMFIPLHRHGDIECLHVTSGSIDVYLGDHGGWVRLGTGDSVVIQPDEPHAIRNVTDQPAEVLAIVTVKLATFLRELGMIAAKAGGERPLAERRASLRALAHRYGYWLASDTESAAIHHLPVSNR